MVADSARATWMLSGGADARVEEGSRGAFARGLQHALARPDTSLKLHVTFAELQQGLDFQEGGMGTLVP